MKKTEDLTQGSIWKKLVLFALPLLLGSLIQELYNTVDLLYAGNYLGTGAQAAIGASSLMAVCLIGFFGGMSVGANVLISQQYGTGDRNKLSQAIHNTIALCLVGGILLMGIGTLFAPLFLRAIRTPEDIFDLANGYLRIYFLSILFIVTYNLGSGICRALGDSLGPLLAQVIGGLINVAADYVFIRVWHNGVNGVAWATMISQGIACLVILFRLRSLDPAYALRFRKIRFEKESLKKTLGLGVPAGIQSLLITLSNVMAQSHINSLGTESIAAFTAYFKVELILYRPIVAMGQAVTTFVGQNMGSNKIERVRKGTRTALLISGALAVMTAAVALPFGDKLFFLFNKDHTVAELGWSAIRITFPFYWLYVFLQILGDSLRGMGNTKTPMWIVMINMCVIRTGFLFLLVPEYPDIRTVAFVYPVTWFLTSCCMVVCYRRQIRKYI